MNPLWIDVAGWTLLHFLWQGAGIAAMAFVAALLAARTAPPQTRYVVACIALVAMVAAPLVTASRAVTFGRDHSISIR